MNYTKEMCDFLCAQTGRVLFKNIEKDFLGESDLRVLTEIGVPSDSKFFAFEEGIELDLDEDDYGEYLPIGRSNNDDGIIVLLDDGTVHNYVDEEMNYLNISLEDFLIFIYEYARFEDEMDLKYNTLRGTGFPFRMDVFVQPDDVDVLEKRLRAVRDSDVDEAVFWKVELEILRGI